MFKIFMPNLPQFWNSGLHYQVQEILNSLDSWPITHSAHTPKEFLQWQ